MPSIFDLMPASLWPVQPFVSPDEQTRTLVTLQSQLAPRDPWIVPSLGSTEPNPAPATPQPGPAITVAGSDLFPAPMLLSGSFPPNAAQLPPRFNDPVENAKTSWKTLGLIAGWEPLPDDLAPVPSPSAPYGVVPKTPLPPAFRPPPLPPAAWQMPEPDWSSTSPTGAGIVNPGRGAGINPNDVINPLGIVGRYHRDLARLSDGLLPGSGNVISGDWDHISARDAANLALSVARNLALAPLGAESLGARATAAAAKAAEVADATGAAQAARAAASRGAARAIGPFVGKLNTPPAPRAFPIEPPRVPSTEPIIRPPGGTLRSATAPIEPIPAPSVEPKPELAGLQYVDPAIVPLVPDPYPESVRDLQAFRAKINVPTLDTVGVARTSAPGLEGQVFGGASRLVRKEGGLQPAELGDIEAPFSNPHFVTHAEEDLANQFDRAVKEIGVRPQDLNGHELTLHLSQAPCSACLSGLDSNARSGVLKQLSMRYPDLTIHVTWDPNPGAISSISRHLIIREGSTSAGAVDDKKTQGH